MGGVDLTGIYRRCSFKYTGDYYIGFLHSKLLRRNETKVHFQNQRYASMFLVFHAKSYRIVYLSDAIKFPDVGRVLQPIPHFFLPTSILLEDHDNVVVGGHVHDNEAILFFRIPGMKIIMSQIISLDKKLKLKGHPPTGYLQTLYYQNVPNINYINTIIYLFKNQFKDYNYGRAKHITFAKIRALINI